MQAFHNPSFRHAVLGEAVALATVALAAWWLNGAAAGLWAFAAGVLGIAWFVWAGERRYREMSRLACDIDDVLRDGRSIDLADYAEGDLAILKNQLSKMVDCLRVNSARLEAEKVALANALADVSHQIRTPLTAIGLKIAVAQEADDPARRKRALRDVETLVARVGWLVSSLLKAAKADAGAIRVQSERVDALAMVRKALEPLEVSFDLHGVACEVAGAEGACYTGDIAWSAEALENILKNCLEHTPEGGSVRVAVSQDALACRIRVTDTGPGIAAQDLPHVFERFYRGRDAARQTDDAKAPGFGIGLALAHSLTSAQGGSLRASNAPGGGACFDLTFPNLVA